MAGYFGAALGGALEGYNQALANQPQQVARILAMRGELQRQALVNKQLADQQAAAQAYLGYYGGQAQPAPQPPAPGQPSVPASPVQSPVIAHPENNNFFGVPISGPNAPQNHPPISTPSAPQPVGPMGIAPYESMSQIIARLRNNNPNLSPEALMSAAGRIGKEQQSTTGYALRIATLNNQLLNTQSLIDERRQASEDRKLSLEARQQAHDDMVALRKQEDELRAQIAGMQHEDRQASVEARVTAAAEKQKAAREKQEAPVISLINQIDAAIRMIQQDPSVAGTRGLITRAGEFLTTFNNPYAATPGSDFQQQILGIQSEWRKLPTVASNRFKADYGKIDSAVKGLGAFTSPAQAINSLKNLRDNLSASVSSPSTSSASLPAGIPAGSKLIGKTPDGKDVYQSPDGRKYTP